MGQQVETGRLACTIGSDQGVNRVAAHAQVDVFHSDEACKFLRQPFRLENYFFFGHPPPCGEAN
jgi:hypothetical protein